MTLGALPLTAPLLAALEPTWSIIRWGVVIFIFSLGIKYLNFTNRLLIYSNEAVLPFFLFHQTIILIVGWFVLPLNIGNLGDDCPRAALEIGLTSEAI